MFRKAKLEKVQEKSRLAKHRKDLTQKELQVEAYDFYKAHTKEVEERARGKQDHDKEISQRTYGKALENFYHTSHMTNMRAGASPDAKSQMSRTEASGLWGGAARNAN